jgi:nitrous oxide reductase accessory protein NosL
MRDRRLPSLALAVLVVLALAVAGAGCAGRGDGPPPIAKGSSCARCGMGIEDLKFAATREVEAKWKAYDSIECLIADRANLEGGAAWLTDYETKKLLPESAAWVLHGDFPSPMGGGLAAFADRAAAESLAVATHGTVARLADLMPAGSTP